jgi:prepilin-type N-terminal cleavage/methylation domain-containing protein/prepilin-type processing-associated H-X9-DG protein
VRTRRAFTLVELLVSISVMAILSMLLLPVIAQARAATHVTTCLANLRQMGHGLSLYMDDGDGFLPRRGQGEKPLYRIDRMADWFNCLLPYVDSRPYVDLYTLGRRPREGENHVLICPTARDPKWLHFLPYGMNMMLSPWVRPMPHRISELPRPSLLAFMSEGPGAYCATMPSQALYGVLPRHTGRANVGFVDSHAVTFDGKYLGCGAGDPRRPDVRWDTESDGINWSE